MMTKMKQVNKEHYTSYLRWLYTQDHANTGEQDFLYISL